MANGRRSNHHHDHNPHDWDSADYVADWAKGQDRKEAYRAQPFTVLADTVPYDKAQPIRILDLGAGYGALTQFLLDANCSKSFQTSPKGRR